MTDLNDRRVAERIIDAIERRTERLISRRVLTPRYGTVFGPPDVEHRKVAVQLYGLPEPSPGFVYGAVTPRDGDFVRVIITTDGDRFIWDILGRSIDGAIPQVAALPDPTEALRGTMLLRRGGTGVADVVYVCVKGADDAYTWVAL
jgi:hypothetical protein